MKKALQLFSAIFFFGIVAFQTGFAQPCYEVGTTVGTLTPLLKSTPGVCPTPAQATAVCDCPAGYVAVGYVGQEGNGYGAMVLSQFTLRCKQLNPDGTLGAAVLLTCANGSDAGMNTAGPVDAGTDEAMVGVQVNIGCAIDGFQGASKPLADVIAGSPNSTSNTMAAIGGMGGTPQPIMYVPDGNVIVGMQSYEDPGNNISAGVAWRYAPIETVACGVNCAITSIVMSNQSACDNGGTDDTAADDTFTADITVDFANPPMGGNLNLTGGANASVPVGSLVGNSHTFTGLTLSATGLGVSLSASFSAEPNCSLTVNGGATPAPCSVNAPPPGIPTMSEWGLILLALIMFTFSLVFGVQYQRAMAMAKGNQLPVKLDRRLPFNKAVFLSILPIVYLLFTLVFAVAIFGFGYELTSADLPGSLMAGAIVAYIVHFVKITGKTE